MQLTEKAEEILENLWIHTIEEKRGPIPASNLDIDDGSPLKELIAAGFIKSNDDAIDLTESGRIPAENVVRRHRLAERLLADVLDAWNETNHEKACKFEHLLDRGLDDSICSLLGHPKVCPHGKPIPPGKCCSQMRTPENRIVAPLSQLLDGQRGRVAYIYAPKLEQLQKLTAMGILPGAVILILQTFPTCVFQAGNTQFAVDKEIADAIYVRLMEGESSPAGGERRQKRQRWGWRKKNRRVD